MSSLAAIVATTGPGWLGYLSNMGIVDRRWIGLD